MTGAATVATHSVQGRTLPAHRTPAALAFPPARLVVVFLLLLVSAVGWRRGIYYEGGADAVVVAKAGITALAFALAATAPAPADAWARLRATPAVWLAGYLLLAVVGGVIDGSEPVASTVLAIRLGLMSAVLVLVVRTYDWREVVSGLTAAMLLMGLFAAATGLATLSSGRLEGGVPPLSPNAVSMLTGVPVIVIVWAWLNHETTWRYAATLPVLLSVVWATGSRTGLATVLLAVLVVALTARRVSLPAFTGVVLAVPAAIYLAAWTPVLSGFVERGDAQGLTTLNSRTVAWRSALEYADTVSERMLGAGLALKQIPVSATYRDEQILDSSWVSALLQVGILGVVLLALFVVCVLGAAFRAPQPARALYVAVILYSIVVSLLESGIFDSSVAFVVFFTTALCLYKRTESEPPS